MNRRKFVLGGLAAALATGWALRPSDRGASHHDYFQTLNAELKKHGPMRPCLLIDLDRLDHNLDQVTASIARGGKHYRIVEKSLPCPQLLDYIMTRAQTRRLMSFHQPFLNQDAVRWPQADILMGKPLPVGSAEQFYKNLRGPFDPSRQLQWLIDTPERLEQYRTLAQGLSTRLRINIELDVGLHRGGVADNETLHALLSGIRAHPQQLEFAGFMGYDPFVGMGVPRLLGSKESLLARVIALYRQRVEFLRQQHPVLWNETLTLNTAGSPTYRLHEDEQLTNDIAVGTGLLKPTHYDLETLADHIPSAFIATPVIKATGPVKLPALDDSSRIFSWWDPNQRQTFFIYGGNWMAEFESPTGLQHNSLYGRSSNQEIVNASSAVDLAPDDHVFLRPMQTEGILLQFGDLLAVRNGCIVDHWPVFTG